MEEKFINLDEHLGNPIYDIFDEQQKVLKDKVFSQWLLQAREGYKPEEPKREITDERVRQSFAKYLTKEQIDELYEEQ